MLSTLRFTGTVASRGFAEGPLVPLTVVRTRSREASDAHSELGTLRAAIGRAVAEIDTIAGSAGDEAAAMLEFQRAMLEDDSLIEPALAAIAGGQTAETAWSTALDAQIAEYASAEDEYFRARSADFRDVRDRVLRALAGEADVTPPPGAILSGDDITPSQFLATDWSQGGAIVLRSGSATSHVAMLARAKGVPMLVGVSGLPHTNASNALVDGDDGAVVVAPDTSTVIRFRSRRAAGALQRKHAEGLATQPCVTADGTPISIYINVARPDELAVIDARTCDGVGLMRTEFLYDKGLPDEETQLLSYRQVVAWAQGRPVVIRTVDAGGDKPVPGFTHQETNPFLGVRGIRLALASPEVFRVQIRALLRVAAEGNVSVMLPMVTLAAELDAATQLFNEEARDLEARGIRHAMPKLGIMVEVPAVALMPELLADAHFFSIGSNDLMQYLMAASRDNGALQSLHDVKHPAFLNLLENVVRVGTEKGIPVSLCGDAGSDPQAIQPLLAAGLRSLSVAPAQLPLVKLAAAQVRL